MAYQSRVKTWIAGEVLYASDLNAEFDAILATLIPEPDSTVQGDVLYLGASAWSRLAAGTKGQALTTGGASANPTFAGMTTAGDMEYFSTNRTRLAKGTASQLLAMNTGATAPEWITGSGTYVTKALFDANTILYATSDDTPAALTVAEQTVVGRITSGSIDALTVDELQTLVLSDELPELTDHWDVGRTYGIRNHLINIRFETYDPWTSAVTDTGSVTENIAQMDLATGANSGSTAKEYITGTPFNSTWKSGAYYGWFGLFTTAPANEEVYLLVTQDTGTATNKERAGFKIIDGRAWALSGDESDEDLTDTTVDLSLNASYLFVVKLTADNTFTFYINGTLRATHTGITCNGYNCRFVHYIENTDAANASFRIKQAFYCYQAT